jgi:hypothetical protein
VRKGGSGAGNRIGKGQLRAETEPAAAREATAVAEAMGSFAKETVAAFHEVVPSRRRLSAQFGISSSATQHGTHILPMSTACVVTHETQSRLSVSALGWQVASLSSAVRASSPRRLWRLRRVRDLSALAPRARARVPCVRDTFQRKCSSF